jgi:hypothetical protein
MEKSIGVWEAAPTVCTVVICFASCIGFLNGLEYEHRREVGSVSGEVLLFQQKRHDLYLPPLQDSLCFLSRSHARSTIVHLTAFYPSSGVLRVYPVPLN